MHTSWKATANDFWLFCLGRGFRDYSVPLSRVCQRLKPSPPPTITLWASFHSVSTLSMGGPAALTELPSSLPPPGVTANLIKPGDKSNVYVAVTSVIFVFVFLFVTNRLYVRFDNKCRGDGECCALETWVSQITGANARVSGSCSCNCVSSEFAWFEAAHSNLMVARKGLLRWYFKRSEIFASILFSIHL